MLQPVPERRAAGEKLLSDPQTPSDRIPGPNRPAWTLTEVAKDSYATAQLLGATVADWVMAMQVILAMTFGLLIPKIAIDCVAERAARARS